MPMQSSVSSKPLVSFQSSSDIEDDYDYDFCHRPVRRARVKESERGEAVLVKTWILKYARDQ